VEEATAFGTDSLTGCGGDCGGGGDGWAGNECIGRLACAKLGVGEGGGGLGKETGESGWTGDTVESAALLAGSRYQEEGGGEKKSKKAWGGGGETHGV